MESKFGWRGRVGLIMPSNNTVTEPLLYAIAPKGISFHTTRTSIRGTSVEEVMAMGNEKDRAIRELASAGVDCIVDCCTMSGVLRGLDADKAFCKKIEVDTGIRATSTLSGVVGALNAFKLHNIVIVSPNPVETDRAMAAFFTKIGFNVVNIKGMGFTDGREMGLVDSKDIYDFCKKAWDPRAESLFITCSNFNGVPATEALERDLHVPVISSNAATLWTVMQTLGIDEPVVGCGRLLAGQVSSK
jgi:maleate isomerase